MELSGGNFLRWELYVGQLSGGVIVWGQLSGECNCSRWELSGAIVLGGNCPRGIAWGPIVLGSNFPEGNCPGGNCPKGKLSKGGVSWAVWIYIIPTCNFMLAIIVNRIMPSKKQFSSLILINLNVYFITYLNSIQAHFF